MNETNGNHVALPTLQAMFGAAIQFGLTDEEVWETADRAMSEFGEDASVPECLDELAGALARSILSKQREILA